MTNQPGRSFDADAEAVTIEHLAKMRLDTKNTFANYPTDAGRAASEKLANEWVSLEQDQRVAVANALVRKYHNGKITADPVASISTNINGEMIGIVFESSFWDWHLGPTAIRLLATNANVSVARSQRIHSLDSADGYILDFLGEDPHGQKNNQTQQTKRASQNYGY